MDLCPVKESFLLRFVSIFFFEWIVDNHHLSEATSIRGSPSDPLPAPSLIYRPRVKSWPTYSKLTFLSEREIRTAQHSCPAI